LLLDDDAVDEGSIAAIQIPHLELSVTPYKRAVLPRNRWVDYRDAVRSVSPDANFAVGKRDG
ncbi:MAG: hypothetical protein WA437_13560, partial [Candidatus Sulfotelmatobacter sp.]